MKTKMRLQQAALIAALVMALAGNLFAQEEESPINWIEGPTIVNLGVQPSTGYRCFLLKVRFC